MEIGDEAPPTETKGTKLYHIRGTSSRHAQAVEVEAVCASLNSNDAFVLVKDDGATGYIWVGKGATDQEEGLAKQVVSTLKLDAPVVKEESEPEEFWGPIGGKGEYASDPCLAEQDLEPRLFQVSNATGRLKIEEIPLFTQADLVEEDLMLLDSGAEVMVWVGNGANDDEKKEAPALVDKYLALQERVDTSVMFIQQGSEPPAFTRNFVPWVEQTESFEDYYAQKEAELRKIREAKQEREEKAHEGEAAKRAEAVARAEAEAAQRKKEKEEAKEPDVTEEELEDQRRRAEAVAKAEKERALKKAATREENSPQARGTQGGELLRRFTQNETDEDRSKKRLTAMAHLNKGGGSSTADGDVTKPAVFESPETLSCTLEELQDAVASIKKGVDPSMREMYLPAEEFQKLMGMTKEEFKALPKWKQTNMKR